jgi:hypothetical protein
MRFLIPAASVTVDEAKAQAAFEYGVQESEWRRSG